MNAWVSENRICVGQEKVKDKSNEITAIPEVLKSLDIEDHRRHRNSNGNSGTDT